MRGDFIAISRDKYFPFGLKEKLDAVPRIRDDTRGSPGGFEDARCRTEARRGHAVSADIEHGPGRRVERIVIARVNMAEIVDIRRQALIGPAVAAEQEALLR